jgi:hypothetical protein
MKSTYVNLLWGAALVLGGSFCRRQPAFLRQLLPERRSFSRRQFLAAGIRHWGWLFPASMTAALALAIGLPFGVAFALEPRKRWRRSSRLSPFAPWA